MQEKTKYNAVFRFVEKLINKQKNIKKIRDMFVEKLINKQKNIKYLIVKNNSIQSKLLQFLLAYKSEK